MNEKNETTSDQFPDRLSTDPTFRLIGSPTRWDRSAALTSTLHWFETELLRPDGSWRKSSTTLASCSRASASS